MVFLVIDLNFTNAISISEIPSIINSIFQSKTQVCKPENMSCYNDEDCCTQYCYKLFFRIFGTCSDATSLMNTTRFPDEGIYFNEHITFELIQLYCNKLFLYK